MGQYKEWLHYRKIDQQLHAQLTQLEQQVAHLQEQLPSEEMFRNYAANPIIQALQQHLQAPTLPALPAPQQQVVSEQAAEASSVPAMSDEAIDQSQTMAEAMLAAVPTETISTALFAWGALSNVHNPQLKAVMLNPLPSTPKPDPGLLPANMYSFIHDHTAPNTPPPLPSSQAVPSTDGSVTPVDPSSTRTDQIVQRWMTRWKRAAREKQVVEETGSRGSRRG
ncbi:MAG TPA: hypothetical protein VHZ51_26550 [Ktedonobacteraceae bacterium]|nr:hypothetical protein [Ktedonobacteraceae bacterium]